MRIGTKTLLFGFHQIFIHFFFVSWAWIKIFGWSSYLLDPKIIVSIFIHDLGYWGKPNLDGEEGKLHPEIAANWAKNHLGVKYQYEVLFHSRYMSRGKLLSRLGMADKLCFLLYPKWLTKVLYYLSGEIHEYLEVFPLKGEKTFDNFYYQGSVSNLKSIIRFKFFQTQKWEDWFSKHKVVGSYYRRHYSVKTV